MFNYLFSNGDAHFKNFSLLETDQGDYRLSPAYDLLNSRIHIRDKDFALNDGLLPKKLAQGTVMQQFTLLAEIAGINSKVFDGIVSRMLSGSEQVEQLIFASFLDETTKKNYLQAYQSRHRQLLKT